MLFGRNRQLYTRNVGLGGFNTNTRCPASLEPIVTAILFYLRIENSINDGWKGRDNGFKLFKHSIEF
jgi:hypothetical protein